MEKKRLGILTMHKIINVGSALQAFALQKFCEDAGTDAELIDYEFPNKRGFSAKQYLFQIISNIRAVLFDIFRNDLAYYKKQRKFESFWKCFFKLSKKYNYSSIHNNPPSYDMYMVGSDQVWNPIHIQDDYTFLFSFLDTNKKCVSYASSISVGELSGSTQKAFKTQLDKYERITVREDSARKIIQNLGIKKDVDVVCDPTLLFSKEEWLNMGLIERSKYSKISEDYIVVFTLGYSFNPFPQIIDLIKFVKEKLNYKLLFLNSWTSLYNEFKDSIIINDAGPEDFLSIITGAKFVVTTSFHGTIFAANFGVPFYSVVEDKKATKDNRITAILKQFNLTDHCLSIGEIPDDCNASPFDMDPINLYRNYSKRVLLDMLSNN